MNSKVLDEDLEKVACYIEQMGLGECSVLVTGATGLIGSLIIKSFIRYNDISQKKIFVYGMARSKAKVDAQFGGLSTEYVNFIYDDICKGLHSEVWCDYVIHTANPTASKQFISEPVEVLDCIYTGTRNVLEYCRTHNVKGIVYLSSMEAFGSTTSGEKVSEKQLGYIDIQNVRSCYSEGKRVAELLCACYAKEYDLPVRVARLAQTFGPGVSITDNRVFAEFARSIQNKKDIVLHTDGQSMGNYCYTTDAIKAVLLLLISGKSGEAYTVVNEKNSCTIAEMAEMVISEFSQGECHLIFDIPDSNKYGYAPSTKMRLSAQKLSALGWNPEVLLLDMYKRLIMDLYDKVDK